MQATFIRDIHGFEATIKLYRVEPAMTFPTVNRESGKLDKAGGKAEYVATCASFTTFCGRQLHIFPANEEGKVPSWATTMHSTYRGGFDHKEALRLVGYEVQE